MASLLIVSGPSEGKYYPLGHQPVVVGRDEGCTIQIVDEYISQQHMQIRFDDVDSGHYVEDLRSTNGVVLNGQEITADTRLADGDAIDLGNSRLVFYDREFPDRESAFVHFKQPGQRGKTTLID